MKIGKTEVETKKAVLWAVIGVLLLAVVYVTFFRDASTATTLSANAGQAASAYSGMVGGC